jgi:hypothetical protein
MQCDYYVTMEMQQTHCCVCFIVASVVETFAFIVAMRCLSRYHGILYVTIFRASMLHLLHS